MNACKKELKFYLAKIFNMQKHWSRKNVGHIIYIFYLHM